MPLSCRALLLDLDGVLVDSEAAVEQRWRQWAKLRGVPFEEVEAVYHGRPAFEVIREVAPHLDADAETDRMSDTVAAAPGKLRTFEGARALLDGLPDGRWTIATSGRRRTATNRLAHVGLPLPDTLVTADDVEHGKPHPQPYRLAAERLGVAPEDCVVLEDAPAGVEAGRRAGAAVVGVATASPPEALSAADAVVREIGALDVEAGADGRLHVHSRRER
ncbi:MAG: HAD-IA family hydrolase [Salinibacter sp.]